MRGAPDGVFYEFKVNERIKISQKDCVDFVGEFVRLFFAAVRIARANFDSRITFEVGNCAAEVDGVFSGVGAREADFMFSAVFYYVKEAARQLGEFGNCRAINPNKPYSVACEYFARAVSAAASGAL